MRFLLSLFLFTYGIHAFLARPPVCPKTYCPENSPVATTRNGSLYGLSLLNGSQNAFLGVPFATPPTGDLRLRHPLPYQKVYSGYDSTKQPPSCPGYAGFDVGLGLLSEDCLYMNIVRPSRPGNCNAESGLPVLVWIYGGGFDAGGIADQRYNMSFMVSQSIAMGKPIIAVSINYRVGGWGFLASTEVISEGVANIGLFDQRLALRYIKENIAGFGGDPEKITIWGESAGAFSVGYHTIAYNGDNENLFRGVIMNSGTALGQPLQTAVDINQHGEYQAQFDNVTAVTHCANATDPVQCLRELPFEDLNAAFAPQVYTPVVDGDFISRLPSESLAQNLVAEVAVLAGSNTDEGTASFWGPRGTLNTTDDVKTYIKELNGGGLTDSEVSELLALYPDDPTQGCPFGTGTERFADQGWMYKRGAAIATDLNVAAGRRATVQYFSKNNRANNPVYSYRFDQPPWNGKEELIATVAPVYSTHYSELGFVFGNPTQNLSNWIGPYEAYHELSSLMARAWISFVHDMDPNNYGASHAPYWPRYDFKAPKNIVWRAQSNRTGTFIEDDTWRSSQLAWWNDHWRELRT